MPARDRQMLAAAYLPVIAFAAVLIAARDAGSDPEPTTDAGMVDPQPDGGMVVDPEPGPEDPEPDAGPVEPWPSEDAAVIEPAPESELLELVQLGPDRLRVGGVHPVTELEALREHLHRAQDRQQRPAA